MLRTKIASSVWYSKWALWRSLDLRKVHDLYHRKKCLLESSRERLESIQNQKFIELVRFHWANPWFRRYFSSVGLSIEHVEKHGVQVLRELPMLTKETLRQEISEMLNPKAKGIYWNSSGGSTGTPLNFLQDEHYLVESTATTWIGDEMAGWYPGARVARLWGAPSDVGKLSSWWGALKLWLANEEWFDTFNMSEQQMTVYHKRMSEFQPEVIVAYASSVYIFSQFLRKQGIRPDYPKKGIIVSAEVMTDEMRSAIEEVFRVKVFNRYGSREVGNMAMECQIHSGLHQFMFDHIVECVNPTDGSLIWEEPGEIVVTSLNNYAVPFIRYRIGDMGMLSKEMCPCGRQTILIKKIVGRTSDTITTRTGRLIHGEYFTHLFYGIKGVERFQFIQDTLDRYRLLIVSTPEFSDNSLSRIKRGILNVVGEGSELIVEFVKDIPVTVTGKYRFTISKVPLGYSGKDQTLGKVF